MKQNNQKPLHTSSKAVAHDSIRQRKSEGLDDQRPEAREAQQLSADIAQTKLKPNNTGLPDNLKSGIETLSGYSMDDVKVHYNSAKPSQLNAHAYAQGTDIHVASGQEKHLPHEAWHVAQQKQGRVQPTTQVNGAAVNDDVSLEREADVMGGKALQMKAMANNPLQQQKTAPLVAQRAVGMELELAIPIDKYSGDLSDAEDERALLWLAKDKRTEARRMAVEELGEDAAGGNIVRRQLELVQNWPYDNRWKEMQTAATPEYRKESIYNYGEHVKVHIDTSKDLTMYIMGRQLFSPRIIELVIDPPTHDFAENHKAFKELFALLEHITTITNGMTQRAPLNGPYFVGPIKAGGVEAKLWPTVDTADIHVNFGMDASKFWEFTHMLENDADNAPEKESTQTYLSESRSVAVKIIVDLLQLGEIPPKIKDELYGLVTLYAQYLLAGGVDRAPHNTPKNFMAIFPKTGINRMFMGTEGETRAKWAENFDSLIWPRLLTLTGRSEGEPLIKAGFREKDIDVVTVDQFKSAWAREALAVYYDYDVDPRLDDRDSYDDSVPGTGMLFEYREEGRKPAGAWQGIAETFLARSKVLNSGS